jgi:hypothetical protein
VQIGMVPTTTLLLDVAGAEDVMVTVPEAVNIGIAVVLP